MDFQVYIKKFKIALLILCLAIAGFIFLLTKVVPIIQEIISNNSSYSTQVKSLEDKKRSLSTLQQAANKKNKEIDILTKQFYKPIGNGSDTEEVVGEEFQEILALMRANLIKARSINYEYDPEDDSFVAYAADKYHVCRLTLELVTDYKSFERFLQDLYKHEHFLDIDKIEITPYQKNKKILLVNMSIKLYAQK